MELICIKCPRGCKLNIQNNNITGNLCPRGVDYANEEITNPVRVVTSLIKLDGGVVPVKTSGEIPKSKIKDVLQEIAKIKVLDAKIGDVVLSNVLGLSVDIVVTGEKIS